jgi:hypothetical protein
MKDWMYFAIAGGVLLLALIITLVVAFKRQKTRSEKNLVETKDARYTFETDTVDSTGEAKVSFVKGDYMLQAGVTYKVGKNLDLKPGKYIILTSDESTDKFNIRVGDYVREYSHNQEIVLSDNSEITSVSHSIILR